MAGRGQGERGESLALGGGRPLCLAAGSTVPTAKNRRGGAPRGVRACVRRAPRPLAGMRLLRGAPLGAPPPSLCLPRARGRRRTRRLKQYGRRSVGCLIFESEGEL